MRCSIAARSRRVSALLSLTLDLDGNQPRLIELPLRTAAAGTSKRLNRHHAASRVAAYSRARTGSPPPASFTVLAQAIPRLRACTWPCRHHQRMRQRTRSHACDAAVSARLLCFRWVFDSRGRADVAIVRRNSETSASRLPSTFASRHNKRHQRRAGGPGEA